MRFIRYNMFARKEEIVREKWSLVAGGFITFAFVIGTANWFVMPKAELRLNQDFHFGPGTVKVYTRAAPNTTSFRAEPCT